MVNSSCCVIDGVISICMVSSEHEVDLLSSSIQVLEDIGSVVKTHTQVSLKEEGGGRGEERGGGKGRRGEGQRGRRREGGREGRERERERDKDRGYQYRKKRHTPSNIVHIHRIYYFTTPRTQRTQLL